MLDETDKTILRELDRDVRISLTQLAKRARISKEKAHYRLARLEQGVLTGYWGQQRLGRSAVAYKVFLKDKSLGRRRGELIDFLRSRPEAAWIAETEGRWDIVISSYGASDHAFTAFAGELLARFGTALREKAITKMTGAVALNEKYLHETPYVRVREDDFTLEGPHLDDTDVALSNALAEDARASYAELARAVGLTPEAIRYRVRRLLSSGAFVDLKPRIDHAALGLAYLHVLLSLERYEARDAILSYYKEHPQCVYIMTHLGAYDIHLELVLPPDALPAFLTDLSERFGPSLSAYEVLRIAKEHRMRIELAVGKHK